MLTDDYSVRLEAFHGPLDLLLFLIRRAEVDITEISIAEITDQYLQHLAGLDEIDVEAAGEFLVTAAALLEIKSRLLAPPEEGEGDAAPGDPLIEADSRSPAADLVRALLQYKKYRDAAEALQERRRGWALRYPSRPISIPTSSAAPPDDASDLEDLSLYDLAQAFARIAETVQLERIGDHTILDDDTPIELHAADILDRLRRDAEDQPRTPGLPLRGLFAGRPRVEVIGLFLAMLELVRQRAVRVWVEPGTTDPVLRLTEPDDQETTPPGAEGRASVCIEPKSASTPAPPRPSAWDDDDILEGGQDPCDPEEREGEGA